MEGLGAALLALCLAAPTPAAQEEPFPASAPTPPEAVERAELLRGDEVDPFDVYLGLDFASMYVSRGLVFNPDPGLQPWLEIDVRLFRSADPRSLWSTLSFFAGTWNHLELGGREEVLTRGGNVEEVSSWYEADLYAGLRFRIGERIASSLRYNLYTSPQGDFEDIHELDWRLSLDEGPIWSWIGRRSGELHVYPALRATLEIHDRGGREGWYIQPSLTPTWRPRELPVSVELPLILGFGGGGQYVTEDGEDRHFGYFQTGLQASVDLDLLSQVPGGITLAGGVDVIVLSDPDLGFENDRTEIVGRISLSYAY